MSEELITLTPPEAGDAIICVDTFQDYELSGRLYSRYISGHLAFWGAKAMIESMEAIFNTRNDLQRPYEYRTFRHEKKPAPMVMGSKGVQRMVNENLILEKTGEKATFIIKVQFQQNATWQGTISWTDKKKTQRFRSLLELIKLMDVALAESSEIIEVEADSHPDVRAE